MNAGLAVQGIFGGRAGVAAGGADNIQAFAFSRQHIFEGMAEKLHGHVFEGQRGAVGQGLDFDAVGQGAHRGDFARAEHGFGVGVAHQAAQIGCRNIIDK